MGYTHGTRWSDELIQDRILEVVNALKLDRMPSRSEVIKYYRSSGLAGKISKEPGGWYKWAERLNLPIKNSETGLAKQYEAVAADKLMSLGHEVERMPQNFPYDLLVDGAVKIDVKVSNLFRGKAGNFYTYNLEKKYCTCDIYILYKILPDSEDTEALIVPSVFVAKNTQISVGEKNSIYDPYSEKWDYVWDYSNFARSL